MDHTLILRQFGGNNRTITCGGNETLADVVSRTPDLQGKTITADGRVLSPQELGSTRAGTVTSLRTTAQVKGN